MHLSTKTKPNPGDIVVPLDDKDETIGDLAIYVSRTEKGTHLVVDCVILHKDENESNHFRYNMAEYSKVAVLDTNVSRLITTAESQ